MTRSAWIAGATGMVGSHLVDALLEGTAFDAVVTLGRRPLDRSHPKLTQATVDFAAIDPASLPPVTDAFCALGTTIKKAGSREAFRAVDHDAVLAFARAAKARGASRFYVVTALGADAGSLVFYNRVKGETEEALRAMGFEALAIARPSLLVGERAESRPGERLAIALTGALKPLLKPFASRPIEGAVVARALRAIADAPPSGARVYLSGELQTLGGG
ncbi:MAG: NAD(P)H-binding protein [Polyangiales bacterium]